MFNHFLIPVWFCKIFSDKIACHRSIVWFASFQKSSSFQWMNLSAMLPIPQTSPNSQNEWNSFTHFKLFKGLGGICGLRFFWNLSPFLLHAFCWKLSSNNHPKSWWKQVQTFMVELETLVLVGASGKLDVLTGVLADPLLSVFKHHLYNWMIW